MSWRALLFGNAALAALVVASATPNAVTDLTAIAVTDSAVTLRWTEVPSNDSTQVAWYDLRWGLATGFAWAPRQSPLDTIRGASRVGGVKLTTTVRGLKPATSYTFQTVACVGVFGIAACSNSSNTASVTTAATPPVPPPPPPPVVVSSVTVSPQTLTGSVSTLGVQVFAVAKDALGATLAVPFTWTSSAPAIARVDSNGIVFFVAPGTATVTASAGGISGSAVVTVTPAPLPVPTAWSIRDSLLLTVPLFAKPPCLVQLVDGITTTCGPYPVSATGTGLVSHHVTISIMVSP